MREEGEGIGKREALLPCGQVVRLRKSGCKVGEKKKGGRQVYREWHKSSSRVI